MTPIPDPLVSPSSGDVIPRELRTQGISMWPLFGQGTRIGVRPVTLRDLRPGDVIAFEQNGRTIAHRLLEVTTRDGEPALREKGDNNLFSSWIQPHQVKGRVVRMSRGITQARLDIDPSHPALQRLVRWSFGEARLAEQVRALRMKSGLPPLPAWVRWLAVGPLLPALLVRWAVAAAARRAYPLLPPESGPVERQFLLECFRAVCEAGSAQPPVVPHDLSWAGLLQVASEHGLSSRLERLFGSLNPPPPAVVFEELRKRKLRDALAHMSGLATLRDVESALGPRGLSCAILKGPALVLSLYGESGVRAYGDVDLLVSKRDLEPVVAALRDVGFREPGNALVRRLRRRAHFVIDLISDAASRLKLELHWSIIDRANLYRVDGAEILSRLRRLRGANLEFSALAVEDEFIFLCIHAAKHGILNGLALAMQEPAVWFCGRPSGNRLTWFEDLHRFLTLHGATMDWPAICERAERWNTMDDVRVTVAVLNLLLPGSPAARALAALNYSGPPPVRGLALLRRLFRTRSIQDMVERAMIADMKFSIRPVRILVFLSILFPARQRLLRYYRFSNPAWLPILYLWHPFRLLLRQLGG